MFSTQEATESNFHDQNNDYVPSTNTEETHSLENESEDTTENESGRT